MKPVVAALALDLRILYRNGFVAASLVIAVPTILVLRFLDPSMVGWLLPMILFENTIINTFFFAGGLLLLEQAERTHAAHAVTPLTDAAFVASKVAALTILSTLEGMAIVVFTYGWIDRMDLVVLGLVALGVLFTLLGVVVVSRYESINEYLMPSTLIVTLLSLPLLAYFGVGNPVYYYPHPAEPGMLLMAFAFEPKVSTASVAALPAAVAWIIPAFPWAVRCYRARLLARV